MKILFVGLANNVHTARWIGLLESTGWDLHFFPTDNTGIHPNLRNVCVHAFFPDPQAVPNPHVRIKAVDWPFPVGRTRVKSLLMRAGYADPARLAALIRRLRPDLVHSLGIQHGAYLALEAKKLIPEIFPQWLVTNWGADIHFFGCFAEEEARIRNVLVACDGYSCECHRDVKLAQHLGFKGAIWPVMPNTGGFDLEVIRRLRGSSRPSQRRLVLLKGYQHWYGRALVALKAIEIAAPLLRDYRIAVYGCTGFDVESTARIVAQRTGLSIEILPKCTHEKMLALHSQARVSVSLSVTDGICTSYLEAIACGAFPVQSATSCADEWMNGADSTLLVDPDDPQDVAKALRRAVTDDALVDRAFDLNWRTVTARLHMQEIRARVIENYQRSVEPRFTYACGDMER